MASVERHVSVAADHEVSAVTPGGWQTGRVTDGS